MTKIINLREHSKWLESAADFFSSKWDVDRQTYVDSMKDSMMTRDYVPRWYLMLRGDEIIGGCGLIENDFMADTDLSPWLCALFIEPVERGKQFGAQMLDFVRRDAAKLGFEKIYLNTDHVGYYEKYDWRYIGDFRHQSGVNTRVYEADTILELEDMASFFNERADVYDNHMICDLGLGEFYETVAGCFKKPVGRLLDIGCGTGLELERLFGRFPDMEVTGIDLSEEMLAVLRKKYPDKKLRLICGSYFDEDFGTHDFAVSTYSLHHFSEESKLELYRRIHDALEPGGEFIFGDYTVSTIEQQRELLAASKKLRLEQGAPAYTVYHFDTPFTSETEMLLMKAAGFESVETVRQWENASIIVAKKK